MKRAWTLAMAVASMVGFAPAARAGEDVEVVQASRVSYYLDLGKMPGDKSEALVALLKREFPTATVDLIDGTLRVQADGSTFEGIQKVLENQRLEGLPAPDKKDKKDGEKREKKEKERADKPRGEKAPAPSDAETMSEQIKALREHLLRLGKELGTAGAKAGDGKPAEIRVKVGNLCEGCADCLAAALGKEFPRLKFVPDDAEVVVVADPAGQADVQAWLSELRKVVKIDGDAEDGVLKIELPPQIRREAALVLGPDGMTVEEGGFVILDEEDGKEARIVLKGDGPRRAPKDGPSLEELERLLKAAREGGREREVQKLERAMAEARKAHDRAPDADDLRKHAERLREALERMRRERPGAELGDLRERFEALRERLEGGRERRPGMPGADRMHGADRPRGPQGKDQPRGPMAEWREKIQHLQQAVEHLNAAGWEGLAKQAAQAVETTKQQAQAVAAKLRAAEEARAAEEKQAAERRRAEEAKPRDQKRARVEAGLESEDDGAEELMGLVRKLHQQVEELRKEVRELREKVGADRR